MKVKTTPFGGLSQGLILSIKYRPIYMLNNEKNSSGASVAVAGLHMYGFLSLNVKFGACTIKMLNVALLCRLANKRENYCVIFECWFLENKR